MVPKWRVIMTKKLEQPTRALITIFDTLRGGSTDEDGKLFYLLKAACESMKCPPYVGGTELVGVNLSKE